MYYYQSTTRNFSKTFCAYLSIRFMLLDINLSMTQIFTVWIKHISFYYGQSKFDVHIHSSYGTAHLAFITALSVLQDT